VGLRKGCPRTLRACAAAARLVKALKLRLPGVLAAVGGASVSFAQVAPVLRASLHAVTNHSIVGRRAPNP
jgi:hypothetical protein